jgi:serine/threonine protein kinase
MYGKPVDNSYLHRTYRVESELGSGGSGAVYKAWHKRLCKFLVIKEYLNSTSGVIEARRNEIEALKNIRNLHVPQVYDFLMSNGRSFSVMEFIEGESLDKVIKRKQKYEKAQIIKWYYQLATALEAIHRQNICHRDIKPANIMLMPSGDVCLIDFNTALVSGNNTRTVSRSLGYASPEQYTYFQYCVSLQTNKVQEPEEYIYPSGCYNDYIRTDIKTDIPSLLKEDEINWKLSDIFSLGATMYHLITGKRPPVRADEISKTSKPASIADGLEGIIERSMRTNPFERFATAQELREELLSTSIYENYLLSLSSSSLFFNSPSMRPSSTSAARRRSEPSD